MIELREKGGDTPFIDISGNQLQFLIDPLEEADLGDRDYAIIPMLLQAFELEGADRSGWHCSPRHWETERHTRSSGRVRLDSQSGAIGNQPKVLVALSLTAA